MARWQRVGVKLVLLAATVVAMLPLGGALIFAFPVLAVGLWWASRTPGLLARVVVTWDRALASAASAAGLDVTPPV
jgi:hypothetical protein